MKGPLLLALTSSLALGGCQSETVVYTAPRPHPDDDSPVRTRTVNRIVYVNNSDPIPTTVPGVSRRLDEPDESRSQAVSR